jgi:hypothetical protein
MLQPWFRSLPNGAKLGLFGLSFSTLNPQKTTTGKAWLISLIDLFYSLPVLSLS